MDLNIDNYNKHKYNSNSQIARVLTEAWVKANVFCPCCGNNNLNQFDNNAPVADFSCLYCKSEYELKSKKDSFSNRIVDGAYETMIKRINSDNNPNFFFLNYSSDKLLVTNFLVIPKHFFIDEMIEKRRPLSDKARRAGWIGCNILLNKIPSYGKNYLIKNNVVQPKHEVIKTWGQTSFLQDQKKESRGWTIEILKILEEIQTDNFSLSDIYKFENALKQKFPNNNFIKDKIRQQLQILRDRELLTFNGKGTYSLIK